MKISIIKKYVVPSLLIVGCLMLISCQNTKQALITRVLTGNENNSSNKETELSETNENIENQILEQVAGLTETKNEILIVNNEDEISKVSSVDEKKEAAKDEIGQANPSNQSSKNNQENEKNQVSNIIGNEGNKVDNNNEQIKSENKIIGIINDIFVKDNKTYITVDEVEFFRGDSAYNEARKDGKLYKDENGKEFLPNGYYLRNSSSELKTYEVSKDAMFKLCIYIVEPSSTVNSAETVVVKYSEFDKYINSTKGFDGRSRMCWISSESNLINKIEMQYTP